MNVWINAVALKKYGFKKVSWFIFSKMFLFMLKKNYQHFLKSVYEKAYTFNSCISCQKTLLEKREEDGTEFKTHKKLPISRLTIVSEPHPSLRRMGLWNNCEAWYRQFFMSFEFCTIFFSLFQEGSWAN